MPWCADTDPEIAHVGMHEQDAKKKGIALDTFTQHLRDVNRAIAGDGHIDDIEMIGLSGSGRGHQAQRFIGALDDEAEILQPAITTRIA